MIALLAIGVAVAQSCSCSVGAGTGTVPTTAVLMPGMAVASVDTSVGVVGGEAWRGFSWADRQGNSMPTMAMPGHRSATASPMFVYGFERGFSLSAAIPLIHTTPLFPSDMRGDVERSFPGDVSVTSRWTHFRTGTGEAFALGATLPSGKVIEGGAIRGGRGAVAITASAHATHDVSPFATLGIAAGGASNLYTPPDGYRVAPIGNVTFGARMTPRERGKLAFLAYGLVRWEGHDRSDDTVLDETGFLLADVLTGFSWRFWAERMRSVTWTTRAQVPVWQVVGDPWITETFGVTCGLSYAFGGGREATEGAGGVSARGDAPSNE